MAQSDVAGKTVSTADWFTEEERIEALSYRDPLYERYPEFEQLFIALRNAGVNTIEGLSCCGGCGGSELGNHDGPAAHYNIQDLAKLSGGRRGGSIYISYGAAVEDDMTSADVGELVLETARAQGLTASCEEIPARRIEVEL